MLFDILTVVLLVAGCLLLWLNLRPRRRDVLVTPKETADPRMAARYPGVFEARHPGVLTVREPAELSAETVRTPDAPSSEESVTADAAHAVDQNSYAGRVASAMKKLRSQR
jgi:hypothetical protein